MKRVTNLLVAVLTLISMNSFGQRTCASHEVLMEQMAENPRLEKRLHAIEKHTSLVVNSAAKAYTGPVDIPVHVIVVYSSSSQNISDAQIQSQIDVLNEDYQKLNGDWTSTPSEFQGLVADVDITFTLQDIERHFDSRSSWGTNDLVKSAYPPYSPNTHLNMWVCNIGGGILGYAQFPGGNPATDGVVISPQYFGSSDYDNGNFYLSPPFDKGRTTTHEVGHWLNLRHIWGDGPCGYSDYVDDTPEAGAEYYGCPAYPQSSCGTNDMYMNYMDYVDDQCMFMFSEGQKERMRALFEPGGPRETFVSGGSVTCNVDACDGNISLDLTLDNYPSETSWTLVDESGSVVEQGNNYNASGQTISEDWTLAEGQYTFTIYDSYGDGICCSYGNGSYSVTDGCGTTIQSGGNFQSSESITFCVPGGGTTNSPPVAEANGPYSGTEGEIVSFSSSGSSDSDGSIVSYSWNFGDGSTSSASDPDHTYSSLGEYTVSLTVTDNDGDSDTDYTIATILESTGGGTTELAFDGFESGWGNWTDGGSDCRRYTGGSYAWEGNAAINIQDNSGVQSSFYLTNSIDVASPGYSVIEVEFYFYAVGMEYGEDFGLQYYDGSSWNTVVSYAQGVNFNNNTFYVATVSILESEYNFPSNMSLRFMCDASANADDVYIDNITITGSNTATKQQRSTGLKEVGSSMRIEGEELSDELRVYPNPANDELYIEMALEDLTNISIYSLTGQLVYEQELNEDRSVLDISELSTGMYILKINSNGEIFTTHFSKQ